MSLDNLEALQKQLRPGQEKLGAWQGGQMAVSAVPGAGKSHSLAVAAALAIARHQLHGRKQLAIVTYTRSAAANIKQKINAYLQEYSLPPGGFIVYTLHGLALNIAKHHPELSGLNLDSANLIVPTPSHKIIRDTVEKWMTTAPTLYQKLLYGRDFDGEEAERLRRQSVLRTEVLPNLAHIVIREAKSSGLLPEDVRQLSENSQDEYQILTVAAGLYEQYQAIMHAQNLIDYDDMILGALKVLENQVILQLWQRQIFAVFEDEAQDSSPLQERLIAKLAADADNPTGEPNLIRVGDPNQAINSTFTPADPVYFNWFCQQCEREGNLATMNRAGRSSKIIIDAANFALKWFSEQQVGINQEKFSFRFQEIQIVPPDDPQKNANLPPEGQGVEIYTPEDIFDTVDLIGKRVKQLLGENPGNNAAILVRENRQGRFLAEQLKDYCRENAIKLYEVSESERYSLIPWEILKLMRFIARPHSPDYLKGALEVLASRDLIELQDFNALSIAPEQFLYPTPLDAPVKPVAEKARRYCQNLLTARWELPDYQLIPFLGMTLKYQGSDLATLHKLGDRLYRQIIGKKSLKKIITALEEIIDSERFEAIEEENREEKYTSPNQLTIITMHKAKGLDWDYVFIPFLHEDLIPGTLRVRNPSKFLGDFNLADVARAGLRKIIHSQYQSSSEKIDFSEPIKAWQEAENLKKAEEFRLLYVAMTRAKRLLWISAEKKAPFSWSIFSSSRPENLQNKKPCPLIPLLTSKFSLR